MQWPRCAHEASWRFCYSECVLKDDLAQPGEDHEWETFRKSAGIRQGHWGVAGRACSWLSVTRASWETGLKMQLDRQAGCRLCWPTVPDWRMCTWLSGWHFREVDPLDVGSRLGQRGPLDRGLLSGSPRAPRCLLVAPLQPSPTSGIVPPARPS